MGRLGGVGVQGGGGGREDQGSHTSKKGGRDPDDDYRIYIIPIDMVG